MSLKFSMITLTLAIPIYLFFNWLLNKKEIGKEKNRKGLAIIPTIIISPIIYFSVIILWISALSYYPKYNFNQKEWETNIEERYKMSKNIINSKVLIGKTKEEVIEMLGENFTKYSENHFGYYLGFVPRFISIDADVLDIHFENEKVIKVGQHES